MIPESGQSVTSMLHRCGLNHVNIICALSSHQMRETWAHCLTGWVWCLTEERVLEESALPSLILPLPRIIKSDKRTSLSVGPGPGDKDFNEQRC